jgi:DNA-binding NtrC family response regulator
MRNITVLVLDDEIRITEKIRQYLLKNEFETFCANEPEQAFQILHEQQIDIVISDVLLPQMNGIEVLKKIKKDFPQTEVIMISGHSDIDTVIEAIRLGAVDFIRKPFHFMDVQLAIERTGKYISLQKQLSEKTEQMSLISRELESKIEKNFIGVSESIKNALNLAMRAAKDKDVNVLITGENGTGKEIIARIIHYASDRKKMPFFPVNSAAIPETLLESEFFGHMKGAFTGAFDHKKGCMELANGGTLFLDEIADMPLTLQAKLLRVLEDRKIKRVGGSKEMFVDIRIITATNRKIEDLIQNYKFRLDLFHRINTLQIHIPPLRERKDDIEPLLRHFVSFLAIEKNQPIPEIDNSVLIKLKRYSFPGNVRELRNMAERALILSSGNKLSDIDFLLAESDMEKIIQQNLNLDENEKRLMKIALEKTNYNQQDASELLGISRDALKRRLKKYKFKIVKEMNQ